MTKYKLYCISAIVGTRSTPVRHFEVLAKDYKDADAIIRRVFEGTSVLFVATDESLQQLQAREGVFVQAVNPLTK